ncbi:MAG TPA: SMC-Scp complex subunit ScpB [Gammaproteobacteria bacterium]|nr:SMC-Scp complex subunit ScpB [Gammaproteobacteria bacterium]
MNEEQQKAVVEAVLMAAGEPLGLQQIQAVFEDHERPDTLALQQILDALEEDYRGRGAELRRVASGYRFQVPADWSRWVSRLWEERPGRYSRAMLETLALIAYRQPITRGEIEDVRGVTVSTSIVRTLQERGWIRVVGHRDVPGRPALYGTTREFLDYFNLHSLDQLPSLAEIRDLDSINVELDFGRGADGPASGDADAPGAES